MWEIVESHGKRCSILFGDLKLNIDETESIMGLIVSLVEKPNLTRLRKGKRWSAYMDDGIWAGAGGDFDVNLSATKWKQILGCWGKYALCPGEKMS